MADFHGHLALEASARPPHGTTFLRRQAFRAPFHLSKPYWDDEARVLLVQIVNPTAGILAGDRLESVVRVRGGAALLLTTPSASRVFRMRQGVARSRQEFRVEKGGWLEVLPEPLVPHRGCSYHQQTVIQVEEGGGLFFADLLMPGRIAHGEAWAWDRLELSLELRVGKTLVLRERFDPTGPELAALAGLAGSGKEACFGNAVYVPAVDDAEPAWVDALGNLHGDGLWLGVSRLRASGWSIKFVAESSLRLREALAAVRAVIATVEPRLACDARKL